MEVTGLVRKKQNLPVNPAPRRGFYHDPYSNLRSSEPKLNAAYPHLNT